MFLLISMDANARGRVSDPLRGGYVSHHKNIRWIDKLCCLNVLLKVNLPAYIPVFFLNLS